MKNFLFVLILIFYSYSGSFAQTESDTVSVLFVGNSYTYFNNLAQIVSIISDSMDTKIKTRKSVIGGAKLREHWFGERDLQTKSIISSGDFDIVVLQDFSMNPIDVPDSTLKYIRLFSEFIKQNGAKPYLFITWAREKVPQFQSELDSIYLEAANKSGAIPIPVGPAWDMARNIRSGIELFDDDGTHPSDLGTFLTASIFATQITGEIPSALPLEYKINDEHGEWIQLMFVDTLDMIFCLKIAEKLIEFNKVK